MDEVAIAERVTTLEIKVAEMDAQHVALDGEVDAIQAIHQNKEKIIDLDKTVTGLYRVIKAALIAGIGTGLIVYSDAKLQDGAVANDELGVWMSRGGLATVIYSIVVLTNQEAIAAGLLSTMNPWKRHES
jgi:hypothetical protein